MNKTGWCTVGIINHPLRQESGKMKGLMTHHSGAWGAQEVVQYGLLRFALSLTIILGYGWLLCWQMNFEVCVMRDDRIYWQIKRRSTRTDGVITVFRVESGGSIDVLLQKLDVMDRDNLTTEAAHSFSAQVSGDVSIAAESIHPVWTLCSVSSPYCSHCTAA